MSEAFRTHRKFGVEIETVGLSRTQIFDALNKAGINCQIESLNHDTRPHWKIVPDGSLIHRYIDSNGLEYAEAGFEVVSPVLSGVKGLLEVEKVVNTLVARGAKVNNTCGLHVHVDARDMTAEQIFVAVKRYRIHEALLDTFVKVERRNSSFAQGMASVERFIEEIRNDRPITRVSARTLCDYVERCGRYRKLNLCSYLRHGTLEFRQHHGSLDADEIVNWIMLCVTFIDDSMRIRANKSWWSKFSVGVDYRAPAMALRVTRHDFQDSGVLANLPEPTREFYQKRAF